MSLASSAQLSGWVASIENGGHIVDLACGDGALLRTILQNKNSTDLNLTRIDMSVGELELGDPRTRSEAGLKSLFYPEHFTEIQIHDFKIDFHEKPEDLISFFMLMYGVGLLSANR